MSIRRKNQNLVKSYTRPEPRPLEKRLKDFLEPEVDEKFYLTDEQVASFVASSEKAEAKGNGFRFAPIERERERNRGSHNSNESRESADRQLHQGIVGRVEAIKGHDQIKRVYGEDGMSPTISTMQGGNREPKVAIKTANKTGFDWATNGDGIDLGYPNSTTRRGRVGHGVSKTIPTGGEIVWEH